MHGQIHRVEAGRFKERAHAQRFTYGGKQHRHDNRHHKSHVVAGRAQTPALLDERHCHEEECTDQPNIGPGRQQEPGLLGRQACHPDDAQQHHENATRAAHAEGDLFQEVGIQPVFHGLVRFGKHPAAHAVDPGGSNRQRQGKEKEQSWDQYVMQTAAGRVDLTFGRIPLKPVRRSA